MKTLTVLLLAIVLAGCASADKLTTETYDFGLPGAAGAPAGQDVFLADIRAADWLNTTDMLYRLEYRDPRVLTPYSASRWAGTPAAMLTMRLRESVGNGTPVRGRQTRCGLTLFLSEFSHVFATEQDSRAVVHLRATLTVTATSERPSVREFRIEQPAPSPNAAGAAAAFSDVAAALARQLNAWIAEAGTCSN